MNSLTVNNPFVQESTLVNVFHAVIDGISQLAVNARDLHKFLNVGRDFSTWIKNRISEYKFSVNLDFISFPQIGGKPTGGRPTVEYHLTLDTAKELAMVEKTPEGRSVRRYFIQCEKMLRRSDSEQRTSLRQACERLASGNMLVSDAYKYVGSHFGYPDGIINIPVSLLPEAVVFTYEMILARQKPSQIVSEGVLMNNRMWKDVGFVKTEQVCLKTQELSTLLAKVDEKISEIKRAHVIIFDSFSEQKWNGLTPEQLELVDKQGKLFL